MFLLGANLVIKVILTVRRGSSFSLAGSEWS